MTEVRKIESNCFEQINRIIEKIKWKGELKNIKRDGSDKKRNVK